MTKQHETICPSFFWQAPFYASCRICKHDLIYAESYAFARQLAMQHYENFPVGSVLIPRPLQPHFYSICAFSHLADDIADELYESATETKFAALDALERMLLHPDEVYGNPILSALHETMRMKAILETASIVPYTNPPTKQCA
jgi:hypothetical protein